MKCILVLIDTLTCFHLLITTNQISIQSPRLHSETNCIQLGVWYSLLVSATHKSDGTLVNWTLKLFGFP